MDTDVTEVIIVQPPVEEGSSAMEEEAAVDEVVMEADGGDQVDLSQIEETADDESPTKMPHKKKCGPVKIYTQKYRKNWEELEACRDWLQEHRQSALFAWCRVCQKALRARKKDLLGHANSERHKQNMAYFEEAGQPIIDSPQTLPSAKKSRVTFQNSLLFRPELAGWLCAIPNNTKRGWCKYCACRLTPQLKTLQTHAKSQKHVANEAKAPVPPPEDDVDGEDGRNLPPFDDSAILDSVENDEAAPDIGKRVRRKPLRFRERSASPLLESDFAGRVTYSIGIGNRKVGFIGAGQIAQAIAHGMLEQGLLLPSDVIASAPSQRNQGQWRRWKCSITSDNDEVIREADIIFLAVKSSVLASVISKLSPVADGKTRLVISVVPGVTRNRLIELLETRFRAPEQEDALAKGEPGDDQGYALHVVRAAPNKMVAISAGFCAYCMSPDLPHALYLVVETMFSAVGMCVHVEESLMDAYSTMVSSGAAFTCAFIEAMVQGGVNQNMPWDDALKAAATVVSGTSQLLIRSGMEPSALRKAIATPGGSTIAALNALQRGGLDDAVVSAMDVGCSKTTETGARV